MLTSKEYLEITQKNLDIHNAKSAEKLQERMLRLVDAAYATGIQAGFMNAKKGRDPYDDTKHEDKFQEYLESEIASRNKILLANRLAYDDAVEVNSEIRVLEEVLEFYKDVNYGKV